MLQVLVMAWVALLGTLMSKCVLACDMSFSVWAGVVFTQQCTLLLLCNIGQTPAKLIQAHSVWMKCETDTNFRVYR